MKWLVKFQIGLITAAIMQSVVFGQHSNVVMPSTDDSLKVREVALILPGRDKGVEFQGKMIMPVDEGKYPLVLLIGGSGFTGQKQEISANKFFPELAVKLGSEGNVAVWWDFPFSGSETTFDMFLDVKEIIHFLKSRPGIDSSRIGLIGYDEGGLIATMVAGELETISFLVLMATPAIRGEAFLLARQSSIARGMGVQEETIDEQQKLLRDVHTILKKNSDPARSREKIQKLNPGFTADEISFYNSAWYRTFMVIDPEVYLKLVSCPVLALNGSLDTSCDPKTNLEAMEKAFIFSGNANYTLEELPDLNHHFQIARTGSPEEYSLVSVSFAPVVPERIAAWIRDRKVKREK